jgi:DNA repair exonuclease SbcCD ATPase subunit
MLRQLTLRNWRNYKDLTVNFQPGTTFVVASNGVGKTSIVEAARWALFGGHAAREKGAVRLGESAAYASVELELPDRRVVTVERTLGAKATKTDPPVVRLEDKILTPEELDEVLLAAYHADSRFIARVTMPSVDGASNRPSALGLQEHLGRYYGVDNLRAAVERLKVMRKSTEAQIKQIKLAHSASASQLAQLEDRVAETARQVDSAAAEHLALQRNLDEARERERIGEQLRKWKERHDSWNQTTERIATELSADIGERVAPSSFRQAVDERLARLSERLETIRVDIAVRLAAQQRLMADEGRLDAAHQDCPVCRRPLDDNTVAVAHEINSNELAQIHSTVKELRSEEAKIVIARERFERRKAEWQGIPSPGDPPETVPNSDEAAPVNELRPMVEAALNARVEAGSANAAATSELNEARAADHAMRELTTLFTTLANVNVALETTESTLNELLEKRVGPLTVEVNQRWKELFPNRGDLSTYSDGEITRTVNGSALPFDSFSTGEGMGATIILRLLVAQMATGIDFCWFDEPLEHLDPDVRRKVASLLSRVTSGGQPLRQVVVTTYEEPLARLLKERGDLSVNLLDVRQAD